MRDGDLLRKVEGYVQVQLVDGTVVGFVGPFHDQQAFPSHWQQRDVQATMGMTTFKTEDVEGLVEFLRGISGTTQH